MLDINNITDLYLNKNLSALKISSIYKVQCAKITKLLKESGVTLRTPSERTQLRGCNVDLNYFKYIDTKDKAYILGILYADGGNINRSIYLTLKGNDKEILDKINYKFQDKKVRVLKKKSKDGYTEIARIEIDNKTIVEQLYNHGVTPKKSLTLNYPEFIIDTKLEKSFILGYFDGDGSIAFNKKLRKASLSFVGTKSMIEGIQLFFIKNTSVKGSLYSSTTSKGNIVWRLGFCGNQQLEKILDFFYNEEELYMQRKYNRYIQLKELAALCRKKEGKSWVLK